MLAPSPFVVREEVAPLSRRYGDVLTRLVSDGVLAGMTVPKMAAEFKASTDAVRARVDQLGMRSALVPANRIGERYDEEIARRFNDREQIQRIAAEIGISRGSVAKRIKALGLVRRRKRPNRPSLLAALSAIEESQRIAAERRIRFGLRSPRRAVETVAQSCSREAWPVIVPAMFNVGLTLDEIQAATGLTPVLAVSFIRAEAGLPCA